MRFGLQKLGRYAAGRLQGSKGVQKYDKFMESNSGVRNLLTAGDIAGATLGGAALLGGGSVGAGLKTAGSALSKAGGGVKDLLSGGGNIAGALKKAGTFAKENKDLIAMAGKGIMATQPAPGEEAAMMNAETGRMRLEEEQRQVKMDEERKRRIAELLMPYIQQNYGSLFPRQG